MYTVEQLENVGGREWKSSDGSKHRVYFNDLERWYGLSVSRYNTGNVSGATLDGERISNSQAKRILWILRGEGKLYYDVADSKFYIQANGDTARGYFEACLDAIRDALGASEPEAVNA